MSKRETVTALEAYDALMRCAERRWRERGASARDLEDFILDAGRNAELDLPPGDPAQWGDWLAALAQARPTLAPARRAWPTLRNLPLSSEEARAASAAFLSAYAGRYTPASEEMLQFAELFRTAPAN